MWCGGGLEASNTGTSTNSDSSLLSSRIQISSDWNRLGPDSFSLINPQQSVKIHRTGPNRRQNPGPASASAGINPLVS